MIETNAKPGDRANGEKDSPPLARARKKETGALTRVPNGVLAQTWTNEELAEAKATLLRNLTATKRFYDKDEKCYVEVPDPTAQIAAAVAICNQAVGLPVQRILRQEIPFKDRHTELLELARTPSGRAFLLKAGLVSEEWLAAHAAELEDPRRK
ncbi:MAG TPA: hypothetical protein VGM54_19670 [Chthoniobacter sp.]|jgi:hypothetical protein